MILKNKKRERRLRIKKGLRKKIRGTSERPRLSVFRSNTAIYAQIIDDDKGITVASCSSRIKQFQDLKMTKTEKSRLVGKLLAERALAAGVTKVVFDRNGYKYHGRVKALAEGAREGGLNF
ncbi:MAG: 50S ribosomal protein L18 [Bacteroidia bacterium]|nr:50S ribosomal protein L18 [Bacteroidia bacterium]MDW8159375.1 50S ribosomal protein L18 [Bacteroidia bacterium]